MRDNHVQEITMKIEVIPIRDDKQIIVLHGRSGTVKIEVEDTGDCICLDTPDCIATLASGADVRDCVGVQIEIISRNHGQ